MHAPKPTPRNIFLATLGTIILGAIGSGIWSRVGDPVLSWATNSIASIVSLIFQNYRNDIFREASNGFTERPAFLVHQTIAMISPIFYFFIVTKHPAIRSSAEKKSEDRMRSFIRSKAGFYLVLVLTILVWTLSFVDINRNHLIRDAIVYADTSISRIAPFIDEQSEEELRAQFTNIQTTADFEAFEQSIDALIKEHSLPDARSDRVAQ